MINNTEILSLDHDIIGSGDLLRRSLQIVLSGNPCDTAQTHAASLDTSQWKIRKTAKTPKPLPGFLKDHLCEAFDAVSRNNDNLLSVLNALGTLLPHLNWINRQAQVDQDSAFVERHRNGIIAGPKGLFECSALILGLTLMMPGTCYPYHHHPPAEFYFVLSPGEWYREDLGWWSPGSGGLVFNPPSFVHAMKSTDVPLLALWGLML